MRDVLFAVVLLLAGISIGLTSSLFVYEIKRQDCCCPCCKQATPPAGPQLRPGSRMPGGTGSIGAAPAR